MDLENYNHEGECRWKIKYEYAVASLKIAKVELHERIRKDHTVTFSEPYKCTSCEWSVDSEGKTRYNWK